ncbi:hypothetical protein RN001_010830 [Aquatica leii]|uniref:Fucosyltransferase n=1 Tax=Aquatica leii TaxID=1421715 RepID=A0AAN7SGB4_9COLE|nr:hypothetical protein RN001_010830 [Aquatica leii]
MKLPTFFVLLVLGLCSNADEKVRELTDGYLKNLVEDSVLDFKLYFVHHDYYKDGSIRHTDTIGFALSPNKTTDFTLSSLGTKKIADLVKKGEDVGVELSVMENNRVKNITKTYDTKVHESIDAPPAEILDNTGGYAVGVFEQVFDTLYETTDTAKIDAFEFYDNQKIKRQISMTIHAKEVTIKDKKGMGAKMIEESKKLLKKALKIDADDKALYIVHQFEDSSVSNCCFPIEMKSRVKRILNMDLKAAKHNDVKKNTSNDYANKALGSESASNTSCLFEHSSDDYQHNIKDLMAVCTLPLLKLFLYKKVVYIATGTKNENNQKHILFWTSYFSQKDYYIGFGSEPFGKCEYKNCFTTNNKSFLNIDQFDAVVFHGNEFNMNLHKKPSVRTLDQVYIYVNGESPIMRPDSFAPFNYFYNWTMTYRSDSDIQFPYETFVKKDTGYVLPTTDFVQNKTKLMAWFVSRCQTVSKRELIIKKLKEYIPVDVYGKCGSLKCARPKYGSTVDECYNILEKNYKFYFSGENSICKEYVTEKLYNLLKRNVVPVVYGGADYAKSAPPNSVINIENFKNVSELADYLKFLDGNSTEYLKYFEWKKHYMIVSTSAQCQLCQKLNQPVKSSVIKDLHKWAWGPNNEFCKKDNNLPAIVKNLQHN